MRLITDVFSSQSLRACDPIGSIPISIACGAAGRVTQNLGISAGQTVCNAGYNIQHGL